MATYGADDAMIAAEVEQMSTRRIAPTANRSVVGIMTEFTFLADHARERDLDDLETWLAATPCSPLYRTHTTPKNAFRHTLLNECSALGERDGQRKPSRGADAPVALGGCAQAGRWTGLRAWVSVGTDAQRDEDTVVMREQQHCSGAASA